MRTALDDIVIFDGNRNAFERVVGITHSQDHPAFIYIYGPAGTGKTSVLKARGSDKDLLSSRTVVFSHAAEIVTAVSLGTGEGLLEAVGTADVLLLDSLDFFFEEDLGVELCTLLLKERKGRGLTTVVAGRSPLESYDLGLLDGALEGFEEIPVLSLDCEGRIELARREWARCQEAGSDVPAPSEDVLGFVSTEFAKDAAEIKTAVRYLATAAGFDGSSNIDEQTARRLLKR